MIISDSDEIPDLNKINQIKEEQSLLHFPQKMFMHKLNLQNIEESNWIGSKICQKKNLQSPQKLRDLKFRTILFGESTNLTYKLLKRVAFFISTKPNRYYQKNQSLFTWRI